MKKVFRRQETSSPSTDQDLVDRFLAAIAEFNAAQKAVEKAGLSWSLQRLRRDLSPDFYYSPVIFKLGSVYRTDTQTVYKYKG